MIVWSLEHGVLPVCTMHIHHGNRSRASQPSWHVRGADPVYSGIEI